MNLRAMGRYPAVSSRLDALEREQRMMQMARQDATRSQQTNTLPPVDDTFTKSSTGRAHRLPSTDHPQRTRMDVALGGDLPPEPTFAEMPLSPADLSSILKGTSGFVRSASDFIKRKKWYHGTGTPNLTAEGFDTGKTSAQNLYGHGLYLTDNSASVPRGYAESRAKAGSRVGGQDPKKAPAIFEARVEPKKVLDLDDPAPNAVREMFKAKLRKDEYGYAFLENGEKTKAALQKKNATSKEIYDGFREDLIDEASDGFTSSDAFAENMTQVNYNLMDMGYDALTHTGGGRTGGVEHQVLILLDPNNVEGILGRSLSSLKKVPEDRHAAHKWPMFKK